MERLLDGIRLIDVHRNLLRAMLLSNAYEVSLAHFSLVIIRIPSDFALSIHMQFDIFIAMVKSVRRHIEKCLSSAPCFYVVR